MSEDRVDFELLSQWKLEFYKHALDLEGKLCRVYKDKGWCYAITEEPIVRLRKPSSEYDLEEMIKRFLLDTQPPLKICDSENTIHFRYCGHDYHMCLDDPDYIEIYFEMWEW